MEVESHSPGGRKQYESVQCIYLYICSEDQARCRFCYLLGLQWALTWTGELGLVVAAWDPREESRRDSGRGPDLAEPALMEPEPVTH